MNIINNVIHHILPTGQTVLLDIVDAYILENYYLYAKRKSTNHVNVHHKRSGKKSSLGQVLLPSPKGYIVDHINRDPLDNRRVNLRLATLRQNMQNSFKGGKFGKGVSYQKKSNRYQARLTTNEGKRIHLGMFATAQEARDAFDLAAPIYHGEFAVLNKDLF